MPLQFIGRLRVLCRTCNQAITSRHARLTAGECVVCEGTGHLAGGRARVICPDCDGSGFVWRHKQRCFTARKPKQR